MIYFFEQNIIVTIYRYSIQLLYIGTLLFLLRKYIKLLYSGIGYLVKCIVFSSFISLGLQYLNLITYHRYFIFFFAQKKVKSTYYIVNSNMVNFYQNSILKSSNSLINNKILTKDMNFHYKNYE